MTFAALYWYACAEPERPTDPYVVWHYSGCPPCRIKASALLAQHPDDPSVARLVEFIARQS